MQEREIITGPLPQFLPRPFSQQFEDSTRSERHQMQFETYRLPEGYPEAERELRYAGTLSLFIELGNRFNDTDFTIPRWLRDRVETLTDDQNYLPFIERVAEDFVASTSTEEIKSTLVSLYRGLVYDVYGPEAPMADQFLYPNQKIEAGSIEKFRLIVSFLGQGLYLLDETATNELIYKKHTSNKYVDAMAVAEMYNHALLAALGGFDSVNDLFAKLFDLDIDKMKRQAETTVSVMGGLWSKLFRRLAILKTGSPDYRSYSYLQLLALTMVSKYGIDLTTDESAELTQSVASPNGAFYMFMRDAITAAGYQDQVDVDELLGMIEVKFEDHPHIHAHMSEGKLEKFVIHTYPNPYGLYTALEELGHAIDNKKRFDKIGKVRGEPGEMELAATKFQAAALPQMTELVKKYFQFAKDYPDDIDLGAEIKQMFEIKRAFFLTHKAVQVLVEASLYDNFAHVVDIDQPPKQVDDLIKRPLRTRLRRMYPIVELKKQARDLYAKAFAMYKKHTPDWRMNDFISSMWPDFISGGYFVNMLGLTIGDQNIGLDADALTQELERKTGSIIADFEDLSL